MCFLCAGMGTICNMGAEIGATTSVFPFNDRMASYLCATNRGNVAEEAEKYKFLLTPDNGAPYDRVRILFHFPPYVVHNLRYLTLSVMAKVISPFLIPLVFPNCQQRCIYTIIPHLYIQPIEHLGQLFNF